VEGGVPNIRARIEALRKLALPKSLGGGDYPVGIVLAPIMPVAGWRQHYALLLREVGEALRFAPDLSFELITHRYTEGSRDTLQEWYPNTKLDMTEENRSKKLNKFGGIKYVFNKETMADLKGFFYKEILNELPQAKILYWT
jgi:spore photoproduct lyase